VTCFNCSEIGHQSGTCPYKRSVNPRPTQHNPDTWAAIVQNGHTIKQVSEEREIGTQQSQSATQQSLVHLSQQTALNTETGDDYNPKTDDTQTEMTIYKIGMQTERYQTINEQMETGENITRHAIVPHEHGDKTRTHSTERKQTAKQSRDMSPSDDVTADNGNVIDMEATKHPTETSPKKRKEKKRIERAPSLSKDKIRKNSKEKILILHVPNPTSPQALLYI
jgi:hypothetical protein